MQKQIFSSEKTILDPAERNQFAGRTIDLAIDDRYYRARMQRSQAVDEHRGRAVSATVDHENDRHDRNRLGRPIR